MIMLTAAAHAQSADVTGHGPGDTARSVSAPGLLFDMDRSDLNAAEMLAPLTALIDSITSTGRLTGVIVDGYASPDGPLEYNYNLSLKRAGAVRGFLTENCGIPSDIITIRSHGEDWEGFRDLIIRRPALESHDAIVSIIDSPEHPDVRERRLRRISGGRPWRVMAREILPAMRRAVVHLGFDDGAAHITIDTVATAVVERRDTVMPQPVMEEEVVEEAVTVGPEAPVTEAPQMLSWYIKTNVPAWAMLWTNIAVEFDMAGHWSAQLPVYYSGFNYFTGHRKYRTLAFVPEVRWWPRDDNQGWFVGAHLGAVFYNVAFEGSERYQDHGAKTPALGGGLDFGYRLPISRNGRWFLEMSLGAGIYHLDYDVFENRQDGLLLDRRKRTFYGIDNVAVSVAYRFDLGRRKGGER